MKIAQKLEDAPKLSKGIVAFTLLLFIAPKSRGPNLEIFGFYGFFFLPALSLYAIIKKISIDFILFSTFLHKTFT